MNIIGDLDEGETLLSSAHVSLPNAGWLPGVSYNLGMYIKYEKLTESMPIVVQFS